MKKPYVSVVVLVMALFMAVCNHGCKPKQKFIAEVHKAVEADVADKQMALGSYHYYISKNDEQAALYYRKAAELGNVDAQYSYGLCCFKGKGVPQNFPEAMAWFRKAAEQGNIEGQYALFSCYSEGTGVPQNYAEAYRWCLMLAEQGDSHAQFYLGSMYYRGKGVQKDIIEAYKWTLLSEAKEGEPAINWRSYMANDMTPDQLAAGKKRAAEFIPRKTRSVTNP
jgi:TPR repeat protein